VERTLSTQHLGKDCIDSLALSLTQDFPFGPRPQNLEKEKEEQRKLQSELAEQKKVGAAAEAEKEKVGAGARSVCGVACYCLT